MSKTREELSQLVADVVVEHFERLRADVLTKMLQLRTPIFKITPMGELYCDGELVGDVRPVFQKAVREALKVAQVEEPGE
jgi:hypothetical protein